LRSDERVRDALQGGLVAVDLSVRMVALAKQRGIDAAVADIERLPFADVDFDAVLANRVLYLPPLGHHRGDRQLIVDETEVGGVVVTLRGYQGSR
jgi:SAM-dependent methyltransferase